MEVDSSDKKTLYGVIILLALILLVIGSTIIAVNLKVQKNESSSNSTIKKIDVDEKEEIPKVNEKVLINLTDGFLRSLYSYAKDNVEADLLSYYSSLNNNQKLYIGNIIELSNAQNAIPFKDIKNNIKAVLGSDLGVMGQDYYIGEAEVPYLVYNLDSDLFKRNENEVGTDTLTDLSGMSIYNYKVKDITMNDKIGTINVYGLYKNSTSFVEALENGKGLERYIGVDDMLDEFDYTETEEEFLNNLYKNDVEQFVVFQYIYEYKDNGFILKDFKIIE